MRAELAATLVDGAPCPVCGSLDHPELCELRGDRVTREQEEAADAAAAEAAERAETIGARLGIADAQVSDLSARLESAGFAVAADLISLQAEATRLRAAARDLAAQAGQLAERRRTDHQAALEDLDRSLADADRRLAELAGQRDAELAQAAQAAQRAARHRESLLAQLDGAPGLDSALATAQAAAGALTAAADAAEAAARAAADAARAADLAATAARDAGFPGLDEVRDARRDPDWRAGQDEVIRDHEQRAATVAQTLADPDLDVPLDPPSDVDSTVIAVDAARKVHDDAVAAHAHAQNQAEQLAGLAPRLTARLTELEPLTAAAAAARRLADLAAGQGANTLKMTLSSFVLAARLEEVAAAASERLLRMTSGPLLAGAHRCPPRREPVRPGPARLRRLDRRRPRHQHAFRRRDVPGQPGPRPRPGRRGHRRGGRRQDRGPVRRRGLRQPGRGHPGRGDDGPRQPARRRPDGRHREPRRRAQAAYPGSGQGAQRPLRQ